jgi:hypothetical protein
LKLSYHLLFNPDKTYKELGPLYYEESDKERLVRNLTHRLSTLGYKVQLQANLV